jgi:methionyl-tRNA formyltransferase
MRPRASPVKETAEAAGLEVLQPARAGDEKLLGRLTDLSPDVATVVAYGRLLPRRVLETAPLGFVNAHFSLLPAYRGAAPVQRAIMDGARTTGVSIMLLTEGMDEGPVLAAERVPIEEEDTAGALGERLAEAAARLLPDVLDAMARGVARARPQDHAHATYAPKITRDEARIDWTRSAEDMRNLVRALDPEPGAWTTWRETRLLVRRAAVARAPRGLAPGCIAVGDEVVVGCGVGALALLVVQPAGKLAMPGSDWARGARLEPGMSFA